MQGLLKKRLVLAGVALLAASLACAAPGGQATTAATEASTQEGLTTEAATQAVEGQATEASTDNNPAGGGRTVTAGNPKIPTFTQYTVAVPDGWKDQDQAAGDVVDTLLITRDAYTLMIAQAVGGGGECHFGGEVIKEGMWFPEGVAIAGSAAQFMRGSTDGGKNWSVCEKGPDTFGFPTDFGRITYVTPAPADAAILAEMDGMVASLAAQ